METSSLFERLNNSIRNSVTVKLVSMGLLILLLLIPAFMIQSLIQERELMRQQAIDEVSGKWGRAQTVAGPILMVPYDDYRTSDDNRLIRTTRYAYFLPETLEIEGGVQPETRYRGIYEVVVYNAALAFSGRFPQPDFSAFDIEPERVRWDEAAVVVGITDLRGINEAVELAWADVRRDFDPGTETRDVVEEGISVRVPLASQGAEGYTFAFDLDLNGSEAVNFVPLGKETSVRLESAWSHPSFDGAFLPDERAVDSGFTARWRVLHLNRNYPQQWRGSGTDVYPSAFGVELLLPVDQYRKSMRAAKYAVLIIALTFLVFFFAEIRNRRRVHPFQYILVGLALCLFYALLLSLSEQIGFNAAYALAALATLGLVSLYTRSIFETPRLTLVAGLVLLVLYGFVFVLLQLQDYALLVGSIGLFVALALTMYLSRNIDWYAAGGRIASARRAG